MKKLSLVDASFLILETRETMMHVAGLHIYSLPEGAPKSFLADLLASFKNVDEFHPPFNWKLKAPLTRPEWPAWVVDKDFDLDYHVRHSALPKPGGMNELMTLISRLHGTLLDRTRPLWEFHLIEGLQGNRFAMYFKMHHGLIDGIGGMKLMESVLSKDPTLTGMKAPWAKKDSVKKARGPKALRDRLAGLAGGLLVQAKTIPEITKHFARLGRELATEQPAAPLPFQAPRSLLNTAITGQRRFAVTTLSLEAVKELAKDAGGTLNDAVMAISAAALRRYLLNQKALPAKPLVAFVPVALKRGDGQTAVNQLSLLLCSLATDVADPIERFNRIRESASEAKDNLGRLSLKATTNLTFIMQGPTILLQVLRSSHRVRPAFNLLISNVPGPREPLYLNGARLESVYPVSFLYDGQAFNITVTSYMDNMDFGLIGCRDALPEIQDIAGYIQDAFKELREAVDRKSGKSKASKPKAAKAAAE